MVIMTNDSPWGEAPNEIVADMVAGYPASILARNASVPYQPGFLQDPGRVDFNALEFLWHNCYECAFLIFVVLHGACLKFPYMRF